MSLQRDVVAASYLVALNCFSKSKKKSAYQNRRQLQGCVYSRIGQLDIGDGAEVIKDLSDVFLAEQTLPLLLLVLMLLNRSARIKIKRNACSLLDLDLT